MGEEKDLSTTKKRGRPKSGEQSSSSSGRPKASSTTNAGGVTQKKKRPTGNSSKKAQVVAAATEFANKANKAKSTSKSTINFDENVSPKVDAQVENNVQFDANVDASTTAGEVASGGIDASINVSSDLGESDVSNESLDMNGIESDDLNGDVNAEINADVGADISASADLDLNVANEKDAINDNALSGEEESGLDLQEGQNENNLSDNEPQNEPQIEESGEENHNEQEEEKAGEEVKADKQEEVSELDLTLDDSELEQLKAKKKKKKRKGGGADLGGGINPDSSDEAGLQGKQQKKKKWWLLLLLLLLLLIGGLVFLFRDVLFPPKPIVIVPQGMIIDIKETGINQFGMKEFIFKPGDTIEFNNALSVGSERTVEKEDGTKEELSPFSLRLRFYIEYQGEQYQAFIEDIHNSKDATIKKYYDWYYWYDIAIPGAPYKKIIESIKLSATGIGNEWQGREVKLVLEYQTVVPVLETIQEDFEYEYDPEWAELIADIYKDYTT